MKKKRLLWATVFALPFGAALLLLWHTLPHTQDDFWDVGLTLLAFLLAALFDRLAYTAGQLFFAGRSGYRLVALRLAHHQFRRENGKLKHRRISDARPLLECTLTLPPLTDDGRFPYLRYLLGGGLTRLFFSGIFALCYFFTRAQPLPALFFGVFALFGLCLAAAALLPTPVGDTQVLPLFQKSEKARCSFWVQKQVHAFLVQGGRFRDMPAQWFARENADPDDPASCGALLWRRSYLFDLGDLTAAQELTEFLWNSDAAAQFRPLLQADLLFFELIGECRMGRLTQLYPPLEEYLEDAAKKGTHTRVLYAWAMLGLRDPKAAEKVRQSFEAACGKTPFPGTVPLARELMELVDEIAEKRGNPS